jgi:Protein of unknown function (DUF3563)
MENRGPTTLIERVLRWLQPLDREEQYLATAADHADLERRIRDIERGSSRPQFVTFNH